MAVNVIVKVDWHDTMVKAAVAQRSKAASIAAGEAILADANKHVPFEDGDLMRSGKVTGASQRGTATAVVSYNTQYARRLHENPQYKFKNGREGKWLEHAIDRAKRHVLAVMANSFHGIFR